MPHLEMPRFQTRCQVTVASRAVVRGGSRGSVEPLDFEKTEMEHLNFLEFLEEKVLRKSLLSIRSVISHTAPMG